MFARTILPVLLAALPLAAYSQLSYKGFIPNEGQWKDDFSYVCDIPSGKMFLTSDAFVYSFLPAHGHHAGGNEQAHALRMNIAGAQTQGFETEELTDTRYNYFLGNDSRNWKTGLRSALSVKYKEVYTGTDLRIFHNENGLKYEFLLRPGASPSVIRLNWDGAESLRLDNGDLLIGAGNYSFRETKPLAWQEKDGVRKEVPCEFRLAGNEVSFRLGNYDPSLPLVIDPQLIFSTYSGSSADNWGFTAAYDSEGNGYAGGVAFASGFPTTTGAYQPDFHGNEDIGILKFSPDGQQLLYATYIGGSGSEFPSSIFANSADQLYVLGTSGSNDFPIGASAFQSQFKGGPGEFGLMNTFDFPSGSDLVIFRLDEDGAALLGSTFFGGTANEGLNINAVRLNANYGDECRGALAFDKHGNVIIGSVTKSDNIPITQGAFQSQLGGDQDGLVAKFNANLDSLIWSTYLGGSAADVVNSIAPLTDGTVLVTGGTASSDFPLGESPLQSTFGGDRDGFVSILSANGDSLPYGTYLGTNAYDQVYLADTDSDGSIYLIGQTQSTGSYFYTNPGFGTSGKGQFVTKLDGRLRQKIWSTTFGNAAPALVPTAFLVDQCNRIYIAGWGGTLNYFPNQVSGLPVTNDAYRGNTEGNDFYLLVLQPEAASILYGSFFGALGIGTGSGDHVDGGTSRFDKRGIVYQSVCATCGGQGFPTSPGAWSSTNKGNINGITRCNNALFKFDFQAPLAIADFKAELQYCEGQEITIINTGKGDSYTWRLNGQVVSTDRDYTFTPAAGTYTLSLKAQTPGSCNVADSITRIINVGGPAITLSVDTFICQGSDLVLGGFNPSAYKSFRWSPANLVSHEAAADPYFIGTSPALVTLVARRGNCTDTLYQQVDFKEGETTVLPPLEVCYLDSTAIGPGSNPFNASYHWYPGNLLSDSTAQNPRYFVSDDADFIAVLRYTSGRCDDTLKQKVVSRINTFFAGADVGSCGNDTVSIGTPDFSGNYSYQWSPGIFTSDPTASSPKVPSFPPREYVVMRFPNVPGAECPATDTIHTLQGMPVDAEFDFRIYPGCDGASVLFTNQTAVYDSLLWIFGNGSKSKLPEAVTVFPYQPEFSASLIVYHEACPDTMSIQEKLGSLKDFFKPNNSNAFSPNGDGINDCFSPALLNLPEPYNEAFLSCTDLIIYNRWGEKVFDSIQNDSQFCWDGTSKSGTELPEGVYYYLFLYDGTETSGFVHLRRE